MATPTPSLDIQHPEGLVDHIIVQSMTCMYQTYTLDTRFIYKHQISAIKTTRLHNKPNVPALGACIRYT